MSRAVALFGGAVLLTLLAGHLLRDTAGYMVHNPDGTITGDITHYVYWTRLVTEGGIQAAYGGTWPETYAVYPPLNLYAYQIVGNVYRAFVDPRFDPVAAQASLFLREGIKLVALTWHVLTGVALFVIGRRLSGDLLAAVASAAYLLNPAALYDVAHWGQPDGAHALFSVLAIGLLSLGTISLAWVAMAFAALAKPQAWSIGPTLVLATLRTEGAVGLARGAGAGALTGLGIVLPFILSGRIGELLSLPGVVSSVMPVVSADAHNFWWLISASRGEDALFVQDSARLFGPLTYRLAAAASVGVMLLVTYWLYWTRRASLAEAAALGVLGWFTFTTQAHENHLFFALPLLSLAWPTRKALLVPLAILTVTLLCNMFLHDQLVLESLGRGLEDPLIVDLRLVNAALNVLCCVAWALAAAFRRPSQLVASATVRYWPRHIRVKAPT